ncbi:type II toxin-antitoxin system HipA family toxin [Spirosoma sp. 209]|uniref:type II toxin-antitoxin system HipA family toxin n=1 Tax=Spirosoma sp. 209 TaxID=1955701 RepID=UPI00098D1D0B|nr:HipA domain-containing protein [Spirosoma sp. 209]
MSIPPVSCCPGTLAEGFTTYSPACLRQLFNGKRVSHLLPYEQPQRDEVVAGFFLENRKRISISGVQEKESLLLDRNQLRLTQAGEQGTYMLKPIPRDVLKVDQVPANEHLTMQIARQVYGIDTAANALVFFQDGAPAYLTKRFDVKPDGTKWGVEDFASLAGRTNQNAGPTFKYTYSYEEAGLLIRQYVAAWRVEIERYFRLVVFNFLFSNGDAHLKNFSLMESAYGDYLLSPAYDLLNTHLHVDDTDFALDNGLFADGYRSAIFTRTNHPGLSDFTEFGRRIGVADRRIEPLLAPFRERQASVSSLVDRSFLNESSKRAYLLHYNTKRNFLNQLG